MMPQPTPAPLHDIVGPMAMPSSQVAWIIGGAAALLALSLLAVWFLGARRKTRRLTPRQRALSGLSALAGTGMTPYEFGIRASDVLRVYLRDEYGLRAVTQTSREFLESLREHPVFGEDERASLAEFLESADLLKFARQDAAQEEIGTLLATARQLVEAGERAAS